MTGMGSFAIVASSASPALMKRRPRVEKPRFSKHIDHDAHDGETPADARGSGATLSRFETAGAAIDDRRLVPGFVAQLLGQVMGENRADARSALAAYRREIPVALVCDARM